MKTNAETLRDQAAGPILKRLEAEAGRVSKNLKGLLDTIAARLFDPNLDLPSLCRESGLSIYRATTLLAKEVGATPWAYVTVWRLRVGAELLLGTQLKVWQIGEVLGYNPSRDTFNEAFGRWSGQAPTEYRKAPGFQAGDDPGRRLGPACRVTNRNKKAVKKATVRSVEIEDLSANLGLAYHERGAKRTWSGHVDRAYADLRLASCCYTAAGELPPGIGHRRNHISVGFDTDEALRSAFCPECRTSLASDQGRAVRQHLRHAFEPVPRDLPWFEVCCGKCYGVVWQAVSRARLGFMDDAWKAWWLCVNADLENRETPPSQGRFIAALAEVERLVVGDQLERKEYCDLAVIDAIALGDPLLEAQARIWRGNVLRALGQFDDGREELGKTTEASRLSPWLAALQDRMAGILENDTNHRQKALDLLRSATALYETLDPHIGGVLLTQQASVHALLGEYENSVALNEKALSFLDGQRDPRPVDAGVPIHLATAFALLANWAKAEKALTRCRFDREADLGAAATEVLTRACMELLRGRPRESLRLFAEAKERFEKLHRPLDVALATFYSVEAYARLDDRSGAIENAVAALSFFEAAGCTQDSLEALGKLQGLLEAEVIDVKAVTAHVRRLARQHGGWLPESDKA